MQERLPTTDGGDEQTRRTISESADKLTLTTKVKRGNNTRDEDRIKIKVKGDDPEETVGRLADTLEELDDQGVTDALRDTRAGGDE